MPKMLFLSPETCRATMGTAQRGPPLLRRDNSGWIEWEMRVACVALAPFPQRGGQEVAADCGRTQALLCVCLYQTASRRSIEMRSRNRILRALLHSLPYCNFQVASRGRAAEFDTEAFSPRQGARERLDHHKMMSGAVKDNPFFLQSVTGRKTNIPLLADCAVKTKQKPIFRC